MKQKIIALFLMLVLMFSCTACSEEVQEVAPTQSRMRNICELATLECYYHNVAKYKEENASGFLFFKKDEHFWVEYSGIVKIGIDASQVEITVDGTDVQITLPEATVLGSSIDEDSLTEDSYIVAQGSAKIDASHEVNAIKTAQENMEEQARNDTSLLANALDRAETLLENYVHNIGEATGKDYTVSFKVIPAEGAEHSASSETSADSSSAA